MTARTASPLPECAVCDRPVRRQRWSAQGGLCAACALTYGGRPDCACVARCDSYPNCQEIK